MTWHFDHGVIDGKNTRKILSKVTSDEEKYFFPI
jgi:hypothetical protein